MRWLVLFIILLVAGCTSVQKLDYGYSSKMIIRSNDCEGKIKRSEPFFQTNSELGRFNVYELDLKFKDKSYNSIINIYKQGNSWDESSFYENSQILSERKQGNYEIKVLQVQHDHPAFKEYGSPFKYIFISRDEGEFTAMLSNYSAFTDKVSEDYLLEEFKKIDFKLNRKT